MGSKKHRKEDPSDSSESESSQSSNDSYRRDSSEKTIPRKRNKTGHSDFDREKRRASIERSSDRNKRSRSGSYDRKGNRKQSRSREYSRKEADKDAPKSGNRTRGSKDNEKDYRRYNERDHRHQERHHDRRNDNDRVHRKDDWKSYPNRRDNRRRSRSKSFDHDNAKWGKHVETENKGEKKQVEDKQKPNFALSGKLTEETNTYKGVVIKYSEPPEARKPRRRWRLYPFKGDKALQTLYIHRESAYLIGRDRKVVDLPVDHPSCSKQHAALQYRLVPFTRENGSVGKRVRPYLIDLDSANGTFINNKKIESKKYVELLERDVIKFGFSSREYVLLHENSKDEAMDDDVKDEEIKEEIDIKTESA